VLHWRRGALIIFLCLFLTWSMTGPALAAGLTIAPATLSGGGPPGSEGRLPDYRITNGSDYDWHMTVSVIPAPESSQPQSVAWFTVSPASFELPARTERDVSVSIKVPLSAAPGEYCVYIQAKAEATSQSAVTVNYELDAKFSFRVTAVPADVVSHPDRDYILKLITWGVAAGRPDGTFAPDASVTREEFAKMLVLAAGLAPDSRLPVGFADVAEISVWARPYVATARAAGLINGVGGNRFAPRGLVTRAQALVMITRVLSPGATQSGQTGFSDDGQIPEWARVGVTVAVTRAICSVSDGRALQPELPCTRAIVARFLARYLDIRVAAAVSAGAQ
jgi:hypothetical protein